MKITVRIEALAAVLLACAPAFAQAPPSDTLKVVLAKGVVFEIQGQAYDFIARPDGSYTDRDDRARGRYRTDGKLLCVTPAITNNELCFDFPDGKTPGETFRIEGEEDGARGPVTVTIR